MNRALLSALAVSFVLTLAFEISFFFLTGKRHKRDLLLVCLVNVITNPAVVLLYWLALYYTNILPVLIKTALEVSAVATEGYYYRNYGRQFKRPYLFSIAANMVSFGVGALLQLFF